MALMLIIAIFFFFSLQSFACECIYTESFCKTLYAMGWMSQIHPDIASNQLVLKAKILNHQYHGVQIQVLDVILGNETRDTLMIWGYSNQYAWDFGNCRTDVTDFTTNDTMILNIYTNFEILDPVEHATDYTIAHCGVFYLNCHKGQVEGTITQNLLLEYMPYEEFKAMVPNCYATAIEEVGLSSNLAYPNPFSQQLFVPNSQSVRIFDVLGSLVFSGASTPNQAINLSHLPQGIYYIESTQIGSKTLKMQKVVKM